MTEESIKCLPIIERQATITAKEYLTALTFNPERDAYMIILKRDELNKLTIENNRLKKEQFKDMSAKEVAQLTTLDEIEQINLSLLRVIYSMMLKEYESSNYSFNTSEMHIYLPHLLKSAGKKTNVDKTRIEELVAEIKQYQRIIGVIKSKSGERIFSNYFWVIRHFSYDEETKIISFTSPYMEQMIKHLDKYSIQESIKQKRRPTHSF